MSGVQRYLTDKLEPIELANGRPARSRWRQAVVVLASDYDALEERCRELEGLLAEATAQREFLDKLQSAECFRREKAETERDTLRAKIERYKAQVIEEAGKVISMADELARLRRDRDACIEVANQNAEDAMSLRAEVERLQSDTVAVPRELLERAMYAENGSELIEANRELRALLTGGEK